MTAKSAPKSYTKQQEHEGKQLPNLIEIHYNFWRTRGFTLQNIANHLWFCKMCSVKLEKYEINL